MSEPRQTAGETGLPDGWALAGTAPDQLSAEMWRGLLESAGVPSTLAPADAVSFLGVSAAPCRVLVPEGLVDQARGVLEQQLGPAEGPEQEQDA